MSSYSYCQTLLEPPIFSQNADSRIAQLLPVLSCNITPLRCERSTLDDLYLHIDFNADNDDIRIILIRIYIRLGEYKEGVTSRVLES